jgi:hypothetical protein
MRSLLRVLVELRLKEMCHEQRPKPKSVHAVDDTFDHWRMAKVSRTYDHFHPMEVGNGHVVASPGHFASAVT